MESQERKLGTFAGVFTPSILTILGIILFLRLGYVVGSAGLGRALIMILLANGISILTTVSLSAIATNLKVKGGGDYYLISRTLGLEFGGAIGIVVFLAQSVSIAFYCIGFGEVLTQLLPVSGKHVPQIIAAVAVKILPTEASGRMGSVRIGTPGSISPAASCHSMFPSISTTAIAPVIRLSAMAPLTRSSRAVIPDSDK